MDEKTRIKLLKAKLAVKKKPKTSIPEEIMQEAADVAGQEKNYSPSYIAKDHKHSIVFKGHRLGGFKSASLNSQSGKFAKYWLLNAKETNGNGWGIAAHTAKDNMKKFIGRPLVVTAQSWHGASEYGEQFEHPYLPTNDISAILRHQDKFRVGSIVDVFEDKNGDWFANIEMLPKFANHTLPPFCSPAIYQLDAKENEGQISKWEALHLAALTENPAYGARIALLKGTCIGTGNECQVQFKSAKLEAKMVCTKKLKGRVANLKKKQKIAVNFAAGSHGPDFDALDAFKAKKRYKSKNFESTGSILKLRGHPVARHHKKGIEVSNAGHDTPLTYSTIKGLGIHARTQKGITKLHGKEIDVNSGEWVLAPHGEISDKPIKYTTSTGKRDRDVSEQSKFRRQVEQNEAAVQGRKGKLPLSQINIQPNDQRKINKITGVKSPIGNEILGVDAHHILSYKKNPGLRTNPNNGIMIPKKEHKQLTSFAKLKARLAIQDVSEPFRRERLLGDEPHKLHPKSLDIQSHAVKHLGTSPSFTGSHFLTTDGQLLGDGKSEHRGMSHQILKTYPDKSFNEMAATADGKRFSRWGTDGRNMGKLLEQTGMSRVSADATGMNIDSKHPLTSGQRKTITQHLTDNNIGPDNVFIDDDTPGQSTIRKQLRLGKLKARLALDRRVGIGLRKIEKGGVDSSKLPSVFKPKKIQQNNNNFSTLTNARRFEIKKLGDITKDPSGITNLDKGEDMIADTYLKNKLKNVKRLKQVNNNNKSGDKGTSLAKLKLKLANLGEQNMTYQDSKKIKIHKKKHPEVRKAKSSVEDILRGQGSSVDGSHAESSFLSSRGDFIGSGPSHSSILFEADEDSQMTFNPDNPDAIVDEFTTNNNLPKVQRFRINRAGERKTTFGIRSKINSTQLKSIKDTEIGGGEVGFSVGPVGKEIIGSGFKDLTKALREKKFL